MANGHGGARPGAGRKKKDGSGNTNERVEFSPEQLKVLLDSLQAPMTQSKECGAQSVLVAATSPDAVGGSFWGPRWLVKGAPSKQNPTAVSSDPAVAQRVWAFAEDATGIRFEV